MFAFLRMYVYTYQQPKYKFEAQKPRVYADCESRTPQRPITDQLASMVYFGTRGTCKHAAFGDVGLMAVSCAAWNSQPKSKIRSGSLRCHVVDCCVLKPAVMGSCCASSACCCGLSYLFVARHGRGMLCKLLCCEDRLRFPGQRPNAVNIKSLHLSTQQ